MNATAPVIPRSPETPLPALVGSLPRPLPETRPGFSAGMTATWPVLDIPLPASEPAAAETSARQRLAASVTKRLWSSIFRRRAQRIDETLARAVDHAFREFGRELRG